VFRSAPLLMLFGAVTGIGIITMIVLAAL
jgi:hypothetical protein